MLRRILIAIDGSENALQATRYVGNLFGAFRDVEITVLHISSAMPPIYREEQHDPQVRKQAAQWKEKQKRESASHLDAAGRILQKQGVEQARIVQEHRPQAVGPARDIIREADKEGYDAVVIGKKGRSRLEAFFAGSITNKLLEISANHPLWIVSGKVTSRKILMALDETERSLELVEYAARVLAGVPGIEVLLFHACAPLTDELPESEMAGLTEIGRRYAAQKEEVMAPYFRNAESLLLQAGLNPDAVRTYFHYTSSLTTKKVFRSILAEAQKGGYGTIVVGRKGSTGADEYSLGAVCSKLFAEAEGCALWIV